MSQPSFDPQSAHRHFSAHCFNAAWDLIDKQARTPDEEEQMLLLAQASLWHWTQREDCTPRNLSVGYWQLARIYALLGWPEEAWRAGEAALRFAENEPPFYRGYAHEALARAAMLAGDVSRQKHHLNEARWCAAEVTDAGERAALETDLNGIG